MQIVLNDKKYKIFKKMNDNDYESLTSFHYDYDTSF